MQVKPLRENVLIKRVEEENKTAGGIILPDTAKEKPSEGIVIAAGEGPRTPDGKTLPIIFCSASGRERKSKLTASRI